VGLAFRPLLHNTFFPLHDYTHVARLSEMHRALVDGYLPVRWSKNLGFGYGMPLFNFYAPLFYYVAEIFHLLGFDYLNSIKLVLVATFGIGFWGMYLLGKHFWGKGGGWLAAVSFIYVPYRAVDTYVRGAFGELLALSLIPLALYLTMRLVAEPGRKLVVAFSLVTASIFLAHNLVAIMVLPFLVVLGIITCLVERRLVIRRMMMLVLALGLAMGLAAFYLVPALGEQGYTQIDSLTQGYSNYKYHFLYLRQLWHSEWGYGGSIYGLEDDISFEIGKPQLLMALIGGLVVFAKTIGKKRWVLWGVGALVAISIWLTSFKSEKVWDILPFMAYFQFPWRFLNLIVVGVSFLSGGVVWWWRRFPKKLQILGVGGLTVVVVGFNIGYFKPSEYLADSTLLYYDDEERIQREMSKVIPDFIPGETVDYDLVPPERRFAIKGEGESEAEVLINRTQEFLVRVQSGETSTFTANIFNYPGWKMYINGVNVSNEVRKDLSVMEIPLLPNSEQLVAGKLTETPLRLLADVVSVISGVLLLSMVVYEKRVS